MSDEFIGINICVTGIQHQVGTNEPDPPVITKTKGTLCNKNGVSYVKYKETYDSEESISECLLKIHDNSFELTKKGLMKTRMSFIPGEITTALYELPYGSIGMGIKTTDILISRRSNDLTVNARYELYMEGDKTADCTIIIEITP